MQRTERHSALSSSTPLVAVHRSNHEERLGVWHGMAEDLNPNDYRGYCIPTEEIKSREGGKSELNTYVVYVQAQAVLSLFNSPCGRARTGQRAIDRLICSTLNDRRRENGYSTWTTWE